MCDPMTAAVVMTTVATVGQGYAAMQQGKYEQQVANYNAQVSERNAKLAEYDARLSENEAQREREIGVEEENKQRQLTAQLLSSQRAQLGAAGVELGSGSAANLQEDTMMLGEVDARRIRSNYQYSSQAMLDEAELQRYQGKLHESQADITRLQGKAAAKAGRNAFMGSLLSAGGSFLGSGVADKWFTPNSAAVSKVGVGGGGSFIKSSNVGLRSTIATAY